MERNGEMMSDPRDSGLVAVVDVETTGLYPQRNDRIVELAVVVLDLRGRIIREMTSLINPHRDIGPTRIHGLRSEDVIHAPSFEEIASHFIDILQGTVAIAGHNIRFDQQFIEHELMRIKAPIPQFHSICTMQLAGGGKLVNCCEDFGIPFNAEAHHALNDARATAQLLFSLLSDQPKVLHRLSLMMPILWPQIQSPGKRPMPRTESRIIQPKSKTYLEQLQEAAYRDVEPVTSGSDVLGYY